MSTRGQGWLNSMNGSIRKRRTKKCTGASQASDQANEKNRRLQALCQDAKLSPARKRWSPNTAGPMPRAEQSLSPRCRAHFFSCSNAHHFPMATRLGGYASLVAPGSPLPTHSEAQTMIRWNARAGKRSPESDSLESPSDVIKLHSKRLSSKFRLTGWAQARGGAPTSFAC